MVVAISYELNADLVTPRTHKQIMRRLNRQAMVRVRDQYLPRHFENNPDTRPGGSYGYEPRAKFWQIRKAKAKGHQKPLVFSGRLKAAIRGGARITATANGAKLRSRGYFPLRTQRRNELEAVSAREVNEITQRIGRDYVRLANRPENRRKRRRRGGGN